MMHAKETGVRVKEPAQMYRGFNEEDPVFGHFGASGMKPHQASTSDSIPTMGRE
jgi:hypothetical protein